MPRTLSTEDGQSALAADLEIPKNAAGAPQLTPQETARQAPAVAIPFREYSPSMTVVWEELIRKERSRHGKAHGFKELLTKKEQDRIRTQREGIGRFVLAWCKQSMQLTKHGRINTEGFLQAVDRCQEAEVRHVSNFFPRDSMLCTSSAG